MATFRTSQCQDGVEVLTCYERRCQGLKRRLKKLNTRKSTSKRILTRILSEITETCELKPIFFSLRLNFGVSGVIVEWRKQVKNTITCERNFSSVILIGNHGNLV